MRGSAVSAITTRMLATIPSYYNGNSFLEGIFDAVGRELQRVEDRANAIRQGFFPQNADDTYKLLSLWELLLGLPVAPAGVTVTVRTNLVLARLNGRSLSSGAAWVATVNQAMGGTPWTYTEGPGAYQVTIYFSFSSTSFNSVQVQQIARGLTPAHIDLAAAYSQGFIVGEGRVGEDRL